jgi:YD repeat-containing protein
VLTYAFDTLDRMVSKVMPAITGVNPQATTSWTYYLNGAVNALSDTSANGLTYGYDTAGRMTSVSTAIPGTGTVPGYTLGYTPAHQLNSEVTSQSSYVWQPATIATDNYGTPNSLNQYKTLNGAAQNGHGKFAHNATPPRVWRRSINT